jgi:hypothetical protein
MRSMRVCTRSPYSGSTRTINLSKIRRRGRSIAINGRAAALKQGARIESVLALPRVIRRGNSRTTEMLYPAYPKIRLTSIKQIRPRAGDVEGIVTIHLNVSRRRHQRAWNWLYL